MLKEEWTVDSRIAVLVATHVIEMRERLAEMAQLVSQHAAKSQQKQKKYYNRGAKSHRFQVGDLVLVLLPTAANQLELQWTGAYKIMKKVGAVDYEIEMPGRRQERKIYHVNLMKKWHVLTSEPQTVLLVADFEPLEDADKFSSAEHGGWSGKTADWEHLSAKQFFPLEDGSFQEIMLAVLEPQKAQLTQVLLSYPNVIPYRGKF